MMSSRPGLVQSKSIKRKAHMGLTQVFRERKKKKQSLPESTEEKKSGSDLLFSENEMHSWHIKLCSLADLTQSNQRKKSRLISRSVQSFRLQ